MELEKAWKKATEDLVTDVEALSSSASTSAIDAALGGVGAVVKYGNEPYWPLEPPIKRQRMPCYNKLVPVPRGVGWIRAGRS